jgi:hypothetical protein
MYNTTIKLLTKEQRDYLQYIDRLLASGDTIRNQVCMDTDIGRDNLHNTHKFIQIILKTNSYNSKYHIDTLNGLVPIYTSIYNIHGKYHLSSYPYCTHI